jgi:hypothetical protein
VIIAGLTEQLKVVKPEVELFESDLRGSLFLKEIIIISFKEKL